LVVIAALVFGLPLALFVVGVIAVAINGGPSPKSPSASPPPTIEATAANESVARSPTPEPDPLDPYDLSPGDCYNSAPLPPDGTSVRIDTVEPVPCSEPHTAQVVARFTYTDFTWSDATDSKSTDDCERSFRTSVPRKVLSDDRYKAARIHTERAAPGLQSVFAACVIATDAPTTESVVKS
jgi:hypothetical protein